MAAFFSMPALAADDAKSEIAARCESQLGGFGPSMVEDCIAKDLKVHAELEGYAKEHQPIIDGCYEKMKAFGFGMVKSCADQKISAK